MRFRGPVYIATPVFSDDSQPDDVAAALESMGFAALNPCSLREQALSWTWEQQIRNSLKMLLEAETVIVLSGWQDSWSAVVAKELADELGMEVLEWTEIETYLSAPEILSANETTDSAPAVAIVVGTGTTAEPARSEASTVTAHATGSPYAGRATRGHIRSLPPPDEKD